jgi:hypothetical protein
MGRRTWIKVYCDQWLKGTLITEDIEIRGIWIGILAMAGNSSYGDTMIGKICLENDVPLTDDQIANVLKVPKKLWIEAKKILVREDRIDVRDDIIYVTNWNRYQSEYDRVRKYQKSPQKLQPEVTSNDTPVPTEKDTPKHHDEKEKEKEKEIKDQELPNGSSASLKDSSNTKIVDRQDYWKSRFKKAAESLKELLPVPTDKKKEFNPDQFGHKQIMLRRLKNPDVDQNMVWMEVLWVIEEMVSVAQTMKPFGRTIKDPWAFAVDAIKDAYPKAKIMQSDEHKQKKEDEWNPIGGVW